MPLTGQNKTRSKSINKSQVLQSLLRYGQTSRQHIAEMTHLTPAAITNLTAELIEEKLVREIGTIEGGDRRAGRKLVALQLNDDAYRVAAVHISVTRVELAIVNLRGAVKQYYSYDMPANTDAESFIGRLVDELEAFLSGNPELPVSAIGVGSVGLISFEQGMILSARHLGWNRVPLAVVLAERFSLPVYMDNNARAMALAEKMFGESKLNSNFLCIYIGQGIGSGMIVNDRIYRGGLTGAGEFGHMTYDPGGIKCWCGNQGCLERYASNAAISRQLNVPSIEEVIRLLEEGDAPAAAAVKEAGNRIGTVLASVVNMFPIEKIVLAGILAEPQFPLLEPIREEFARRSFLAKQGEIRIEASVLGPRVGIAGAASLALNQEIFLHF